MSGENCLRSRISCHLELTCSQTVRKRWGILEWGLLHVITRNIGQMMYEARFTKLHSQKKEKQLSNVLKGWIFVILLVLKPLSIAREPWTIFEWGFLHIVTKSIGKMKYTAKFIYLHSSQKEMQLSTVRFFRDWVYLECGSRNGGDHGIRTSLDRGDCAFLYPFDGGDHRISGANFA